MATIMKYNKEYHLDDKLLKKVNSFFNLCPSLGGLDEFLNFMTREEIESFFKELSEKYQKNKNMFKQLTNVIKKLEKYNYVFLLLMSFVSRNVDIGATVKVDDPVHFRNIMSMFDNSSFFATDTTYKKFINGCNAFGFPTKSTSTQFVTSHSFADEVMSEVIKQTNINDMKSIYITKLGYKNNYLDGVEKIFRINLNGKQIKLDVSVTHSMSMHLPNGVEPGANDFWLPGGYTSGGVPEMVVNGIPNTSRYVTDVTEYKIDTHNSKMIVKTYSKHKYASYIK